MMFHVERLRKNLFYSGFLLLLFSCVTPLHTVEIKDYVILPGGKKVLGREEGLSAFIFENDPSRMPFHVFVANKFELGNYDEIEFWVTISGNRYKVFVYDNAELEKYFDTSQFSVTNFETEPNIKGSTAKFLAMSMLSSDNDDCLAENSLYRNIAATYLKNLKDEYLKN